MPCVGGEAVEAVEAGEVRCGEERSGTAIREKAVTRRRGLSVQLTPAGQLIIQRQLSCYHCQVSPASTPTPTGSRQTLNYQPEPEICSGESSRRLAMTGQWLAMTGQRVATSQTLVTLFSCEYQL